MSFWWWVMKGDGDTLKEITVLFFWSGMAAWFDAY